MAANESYQRTEEPVQVPDLVLKSSDEADISLQDLLQSVSNPVMVNFIFTSCPGICPVMSNTFKKIQNMVANDDSMPLDLISISIDPDHDTPAILREYAQRFNAGPGWQFLTGPRESIIAVQKAFRNFRGNKMSHSAVTFLRVGANENWVRLEGLLEAGDIYAEYRKTLSDCKSCRI